MNPVSATFPKAIGEIKSQVQQSTSYQLVNLVKNIINTPNGYWNQNFDIPRLCFTKVYRRYFSDQLTPSDKINFKSLIKNNKEKVQNLTFHVQHGNLEIKTPLKNCIYYSLIVTESTYPDSKTLSALSEKQLISLYNFVMKEGCKTGQDKQLSSALQSKLTKENALTIMKVASHKITSHEIFKSLFPNALFLGLLKIPKMP